MYCISCGSLLPTAARFCNKCGAQIGLAPEIGPVSREPMVRIPGASGLKKSASIVASILSWSAIVLVGVLASIFIKIAMKPTRNSSTDSIRAQIAAEVSSIQPTLPKMISAQIRLDSVRAGAGAQFVYAYTLLDFNGQEAPVAYLRTSVFPAIVAGGCDKLKHGIDLGVVYTFTYFGKDGIYVDSFSVDRAVCGRAND